MEGDPVLLGGEKPEADLFMSVPLYDDGLERVLNEGFRCWEGSSLRRETFLPEESRACMLGRVAMVVT
jgi:hypothetical protein